MERRLHTYSNDGELLIALMSRGWSAAADVNVVCQT